MVSKTYGVLLALGIAASEQQSYAGDCMKMQGFDSDLGKVYENCGYFCYFSFYADYGQDYGSSTYGAQCNFNDTGCTVAEYFCYGNDNCEEQLRGCDGYKECLAIALCKGDADCA